MDYRSNISRSNGGLYGQEIDGPHIMRINLINVMAKLEEKGGDKNA